MNSLGEAIHASVECWNKEGNLLNTWSLNLASYSQEHLLLSSLLSANNYGLCKVTSGIVNSLIVQSMTYYKNPNTGALITTNAVQHREVLNNGLVGSYNLFLNAENKLQLYNATSEPTYAMVRLYSKELLSVHRVDIPAHAASELFLNQVELYNTTPDTYGVIVTDNSHDSGIIADIVRIRHSSKTGFLDYRMPTKLR